jgi:hypothetical protein
MRGSASIIVGCMRPGLDLYKTNNVDVAEYTTCGDIGD